MNTLTLQRNLINLGFGQLLGKYGADGKIGNMTRNAVKEFQKWYNKTYNKKIKVDGIPGPQTYAAIRQATKDAGKNGTRNFNINEFRCKGSGKLPTNGMDNQLLLKLEELRYRLGNKPVVINSGYRTPSHNKKVGGASGSQHLYGKAADIAVRGVNAHRVYQEANKVFANGGVGKYTTFTHVDTRGYKARF